MVCGTLSRQRSDRFAFFKSPDPGGPLRTLCLLICASTGVVGLFAAWLFCDPQFRSGFETDPLSSPHPPTPSPMPSRVVPCRSLPSTAQTCVPETWTDQHECQVPHIPAIAIGSRATLHRPDPPLGAQGTFVAVLTFVPVSSPPYNPLRRR